MKRFYVLGGLLMAGCLLISPDLEARGGRGGGGRMGGGRPMNRSPSMSRNVGARPQMNRGMSPGGRPQMARPSARPGVPSQGGRPAMAQRPGGGAPTRSQVRDFLQQPGSRPAGQFSGNRLADSRPMNRSFPDHSQFRDNIRNRVGENRPDRGNWFNQDFWNRHNINPPYRYPNAWRWATAAGVAGWLGWGGQPYYYGYSDDGDWGPSYDSSGTDSGASDTTGTGAAPAPASSYPQEGQQVQQTATAAGQSDDQNWMPLGVFALSNDQGTIVTPNLYLQLALSRQGTISGAVYNSTTDQTYQVEGMVDQNSQRAVWKISGNDASPIIETGIYNLTQNVLPAKVNYPDGRSQSIYLVRMEQPS